MLSRRRFLTASVAAGAGLAVAAPFAVAIDPLKRTGKPHMRLSLAGYSFRKYLTADPKTKDKPQWTYDDFIDLAAIHDCDAVELTGYYFTDTTPEELEPYLGHAEEGDAASCVYADAQFAALASVD